MSDTTHVFFDVTRSIHTGMLTYPGDPPFGVDVISSLEAGNSCNLCQIHMSNHLGTHIDFPAHFILGGKKSSDFDLKYLQGRCLVVEIPDSVTIITPEHIPPELSENDIVFFKTRNSKFADSAAYHSDYVALDQGTAEVLLAKKVKIAGIDYFSVDRAGGEDFPVHKTLLGANILIVENLFLKDVPPGYYEARIYPLKIRDIDGAPATVSLEK